MEVTPSTNIGSKLSLRRSAPCVVPRVPLSYSASVVTITNTRKGDELESSPPSVNVSSAVRVARCNTCSKSCSCCVMEEEDSESLRLCCYYWCAHSSSSLAVADDDEMRIILSLLI